MIIPKGLRQPEIKTKMIRVGDLYFEVDCCGKGNKLILCLHGFPESSFSWRNQIPVLANLGYKVWAPNLRGYGNSSKPKKVSDYSVDKILKDIFGLIKKSEASQVILLGHDWGGALAWYYAAQELSPIEKLITLNGPHPLAFKKSMDWRQKFMSWYIYFFQLPYLPEWLLGFNQCWMIGKIFEKTCVNRDLFSAEIKDVYRAAASQPGSLKAMINYYRAFFWFPVKFAKANQKKKNISIPSLIIWGEQDIALSKEIALNTKSYVDNLLIKFIPNGSHWIQQDCPQEVNRILTDFIKN